MWFSLQFLSANTRYLFRLTQESTFNCDEIKDIIDIFIFYFPMKHNR
jgi:hypothetical protein